MDSHDASSRPARPQVRQSCFSGPAGERIPTAVRGRAVEDGHPYDAAGTARVFLFHLAAGGASAFAAHVEQTPRTKVKGEFDVGPNFLRTIGNRIRNARAAFELHVPAGRPRFKLYKGVSLAHLYAGLLGKFQTTRASPYRLSGMRSLTTRALLSREVIEIVLVAVRVPGPIADAVVIADAQLILSCGGQRSGSQRHRDRLLVG